LGRVSLGGSLGVALSLSSSSSSPYETAVTGDFTSLIKLSSLILDFPVEFVMRLNADLIAATVALVGVGVESNDGLWFSSSITS